MGFNLYNTHRGYKDILYLKFNPLKRKFAPYNTLS
jgi:hypothetical protein